MYILSGGNDILVSKTQENFVQMIYPSNTIPLDSGATNFHTNNVPMIYY